jgi:hypothetical protein
MCIERSRSQTLFSVLVPNRISRHRNTCCYLSASVTDICSLEVPVFDMNYVFKCFGNEMTPCADAMCYTLVCGT